MVKENLKALTEEYDCSGTSIENNYIMSGYRKQVNFGFGARKTVI